MRNVIAGLFISLDGVVEAPNEWQYDHFDEGLAAAMTAHIDAEDAVLLGRVTYQEWAPYWPTSKDEPYASHINNTPKYVVSGTLKRVDWSHSRLLGPDLRGEIAKLKRQPGKNIGVAGSPTLVRSLLDADLLDELILMVHPVVAGKGKRLFPEGGSRTRLALADSKPTPTGVLINRYRRRGD